MYLQTFANTASPCKPCLTPACLYQLVSAESIPLVCMHAHNGCEYCERATLLPLAMNKLNAHRYHRLLVHNFLL